jgi:copper homeostasis protein
MSIINAKAIWEVCAFNIQSCIIAEKVGAARVELCDNPIEGGTTPSYGAIRKARESISILLYPIIRPKSGNYYYDSQELDILEKDIKMCKELKCDGVSVGVQHIDGTIDIESFKRVIEWAYPMGVTCNRAFDATPDMHQALEDIIEVGCERVLTSGQATGAPEAGEVLGKLVKQAGERIIIMPGAGIHSGNIEQLMKESGAKEYHGSARRLIPNPMSFSNPLVLDAGNVYISDEEELKKILSFFQ